MIAEMEDTEKERRKKVTTDAIVPFMGHYQKLLYPYFSIQLKCHKLDGTFCIREMTKTDRVWNFNFFF